VNVPGNLKSETIYFVTETTIMKSKIECSECKNEKCFIKQGCWGEWLNKISSSKYQHWYKKGDYIFREGEPIYGIYFIQQGGVKVVTTSLHGREQIVRLAKEGQILGHRGLGRTKYYFNSVAIKDSLICFVENELFYEACMNCPEFAYNLIFFYASELRRAELRVKYQAQMNIREKVAMAFIYCYEVFGMNRETKMLNISLSRQDIADLAGTTAEQVTRQLSDFDSEKLIARKKREIIFLNIKGLENIVSDYKIE
jgi:CRP-like cAMP-binding protein